MVSVICKAFFVLDGCAREVSRKQTRVTPRKLPPRKLSPKRKKSVSLSAIIRTFAPGQLKSVCVCNPTAAYGRCLFCQCSPSFSSAQMFYAYSLYLSKPLCCFYLSSCFRFWGRTCSFISKICSYLFFESLSSSEFRAGSLDEFRCWSLNGESEIKKLTRSGLNAVSERDFWKTNLPFSSFFILHPLPTMRKPLAKRPFL